MKHSNVDGRNMSYISISQQIYVKQRHPIVNQQLKKEKQDLAKQISFLFHMDTYRSTIVGSRAPRDAGQIPSRPVPSRPGTGRDGTIKLKI